MEKLYRNKWDLGKYHVSWLSMTFNYTMTVEKSFRRNC